jgi:hypothetical protein
MKRELALAEWQRAQQALGAAELLTARLAERPGRSSAASGVI